MAISIYYEVPLFVFILIAIYVIYQLVNVRKYLADGELKDSQMWLILGAVFFALWATIHIYFDMFPVAEDKKLFFHYIISHGMCLISMICIGISAKKTGKIYSNLTEK